MDKQFGHCIVQPTTLQLAQACRTRPCRISLSGTGGIVGGFERLTGLGGVEEKLCCPGIHSN
eukprot:3833686-Karenia_brevis.AAC.1